MRLVLRLGLMFFCISARLAFCVDLDACDRLLGAMDTSTASPHLLRSLSRHDLFREYLLHLELDSSLTPSPDLILKYMQWFLSRYENGALDKLQDDTLLELLRLHGWNPVTGLGRQELERLSAGNRARLFGEEYMPSDSMREVQNIVDKLEIEPVHNTQRFFQGGQTPLLSAAQLEALLPLAFGLNTYSFNRRYLHSDDQVFFHCRFVSNSRSALVRVRERPANPALILNPAYAKSHAFISSFVMYPDELAATGLALGKDLPAHLSGAIREMGPHFRLFYGYDTDAKEWFLKKFGDALIELRQLRHRSDFTVPDFLALVKNVLLNKLYALKKFAPAKFQISVATLRDGSYLVIKPLLDELVFEPLGLPSSFELTVPVGIPPEQVTYRSPRY